MKGVDRRDPEKLGEMLFESRRRYPDVAMTVFADSASAHNVPDYDPTELSVEPERDPIPCDGSPTCPAYVHRQGCPGANMED